MTHATLDLSRSIANSCRGIVLTLLIASGSAFGFEVTETPEGTIIYEFRNGSKCYKRPEYEKYVKAEGSVAIKQIFSLGGSLSENIEKLRDISPMAQEFEALAFDLCFELGAGRLSIDEYKERRDALLEVRATVLSHGESKTRASGGAGKIPDTPGASTTGVKSPVIHTKGGKSPVVQGIEGDVKIEIK